MIQCIFTLDYEIYGNGTGSLRDLVLGPTGLLTDLFREFHAPLVVFPEALEFAKMEEAQSDPDIASVRAQLQQLRRSGHEIGLHLHPWWANARHEGGEWRLDWSERNICRLEPARIETIVSQGIGYLREALNDAGFTPHAFRSGLWAMQPTATMARVLAEHGVRVDTSVFKGGRVQDVGLDYRRAARNGPFWPFAADVNLRDPRGTLWEIPIHTQMVPFWRMLGRERLTLQRRVPEARHGGPAVHRWRDFLRFHYPRKFDFCRMSFEEMRESIEGVLRQATTSRDGITPLVAIGHSKDLLDVDRVERLLRLLHTSGIAVTTFSTLVQQ